MLGSHVHDRNVKIERIEVWIASVPYSPDLAPSDFFLFPNLKKFLGGKKYGSNAEVEDVVNRICKQYFSGLDNQFFSDGLKGWEKRWTKCIELQGDYIEK